MRHCGFHWRAGRYRWGHCRSSSWIPPRH
ncbi:hypothetical protein AB1S50_15760 [Microbulbifer sp. 2201CG32-9]